MTDDTQPYHVSFIYHDMRGLEQFTEHHVHAASETEAIETAKARPTAPADPEIEDTEVRAMNPGDDE